MSTLPEVGTVVYFAKRRGHVIGYFTGKRHGHAEEVQTWLVVELDPESSSYLEALVGERHDSFISMMLVHPESTCEAGIEIKQ